MYSTSIKMWAEEDRPREKLMLKGRRSLSDAELLAILIGSGTRKLSALELMRRVMNDHENSLNNLAKRDALDLMNYEGIGEAKAITIIAAMELGRRRKDEIIEVKQKIGSSKDAFRILRPLMIDLQHEEFYLLLLSRSNVVIKTVQLSSGGLAGTVADGKLIFRHALQNNSSGIILAHNHPSGQLTPSDTDKKLTKSIYDFGKMIDLQVLDHLILSDNSYLSFADEGLL